MLAAAAPARVLARLQALPQQTRETLFVLLVVAWVLLPHLAQLPAWASALAALLLLWRAHLALAGTALWSARHSLGPLRLARWRPHAGALTQRARSLLPASGSDLLTSLAQRVESATFRSFEVFFTITGMYLVIAWLLMSMFGAIARRYFNYPLK